MGGDPPATPRIVNEDATRDTTMLVDARAHVTLFGYDPTPATLRLHPRSRSWRIGGSVRTMMIALLVAPLLGLVPPHAPWAFGALVGGGLLARRRWTERFTVLGVEGTCPRCGGAVVASLGRLTSPLPVVCAECHHEASVVLAASEPGGSP